MASIRSRVLYHLVKYQAELNPPPSPQEQRQQEELGRKFAAPREVSVQRTTIGSCHAEWLTPPNAAKGRAVLYLHGGGYVSGSCNTHRALAARVGLASGVAVLLPEYRLAPEHPHPAALEDVITVFHALSADSGIVPGKTVIAGDSAGGGLALATTVKLRDEGKRLPAGVVCISPWTDLTVTGETVTTRAKVDPAIRTAEKLRRWAACYANGQDLRNPYISPAFAEMHGLPPLLIQVGDYEILLSDSLTVARQAHEVGVNVTLEIAPRMWHCYQVLAGLMPEARAAIQRIGVFVKARLDQ